MPRLPIEILPVIATFLRADGSLGTVAALAAVSQAANRAVTPMLYSRVCLSNGSALLTHLHQLIIDETGANGDSAGLNRSTQVPNTPAIDLGYPASPFEEHSPTRAEDQGQAHAINDIARIKKLFSHVKTLEIRTLNLLPHPSAYTRLPHSFRPFPSLETLVISQHLLEALGQRREELELTRLPCDPQRPSDIPLSLPMMMEEAGFFAFLAPRKVIIDGPVEPSETVHVLGHRTRDRPHPLICLALGRALRSLASLREAGQRVELEINGWRNADLLFGLWESTAKHVSNFEADPETWWRWKARLVMLPPIAADDEENWERAMSTIANTLCRIGHTRLPPNRLLEVQHVFLPQERLSSRKQFELMHGWMEKALVAGTLFDYYPEVATMIKDVGGKPRMPSLVMRPAEG